MRKIDRLFVGTAFVTVPCRTAPATVGARSRVRPSVSRKSRRGSGSLHLQRARGRRRAPLPGRASTWALTCPAPGPISAQLVDDAGNAVVR